MRLYRLQAETLVLRQQASRSVAIAVPVGAILKVPDDVADDGEMVEVEWNGEAVQIFAADLLDRGELLYSPGTVASDP